jgi:threonine/homoserine/homoserine lactone efflux protein
VNSFVAFALFAAVLTITPGLDTLLVLRMTAAGGRGAGLAAVAGIGLGCLTWAVASAIGVTAIINASRVAFEVLRVAGVGYLCWLGFRALWSALRPGVAESAQVDERDEGHLHGQNPYEGASVRSERQRAPQSQASASHGHFWPPALRTGLTTNLLNPKVGAFYLSVLPQFLPAGVNPLAGSLALAAIHVVEVFIWLSLVVLAVTRARGFLTRPAIRRRLEALTGVVFLGFGLRLALERAP